MFFLLSVKVIYVPDNISLNLLLLCLEAFENSQTDIPILCWNVQSHRSPSHTSLSCVIDQINKKGKTGKMPTFHHFSVVGIPVGDNDVCFSVPWVFIVLSEDLSIQIFNLRPLKNIHTHTAQCTKYSTHCCSDCTQTCFQQ